MFTLVTASNGGEYFEFLKQNLNNVFRIKNEKKFIKIIVYNLGMSDSELTFLKNNFDILIIDFDFNNYPEHVSLDKYNGINCSYAWKPIIIYEVCEKYGGIVHWMDTRNLYTNFDTLINTINYIYIYTPISAESVHSRTHKSCLDYMNGNKYNNYKSRSGSVIGFNYNVDWVRDFVKEWKDLSLIKECICPEGSDKNNHSQDQSVLTLLYYKYHDLYNFKIIDHYIDFTIHN